MEGESVTREEIIKGLLDIHAVTANYKGDQVILHSMPMKKLTGILYGTAELLKAQEPITGETSDGYHTFNELYHHRAVLFSVIVANYPDRAWKSKKHHDGTMYDGMFIVGIDTPDGQATYHYDIDPYWDMFDCKVREFAPEWDGHTPAQAIERIGKLKAQKPRVLTLDVVKHFVYGNPYIIEMVLSDGEYRLMYGLFSHQGVVGNCDFVTANERIRLYDADYGKTWRVWTGRPTDDQRRSTPWA